MKRNVTALLNGLAFFSCLAIACGVEGIADLLIH